MLVVALTDSQRQGDTESSVTRLCDFFKKFLTTNFLTKIAQEIVTFWANLKNIPLKNLLWLLFGQLKKILGNFLLFYLVTLTEREREREI